MGSEGLSRGLRVWGQRDCSRGSWGRLPKEIVYYDVQFKSFALKTTATKVLPYRRTTVKLKPRDPKVMPKYGKISGYCSFKIKVA